MSYTLRGRLESRLAAAVPALVAATLWALLVDRWWPLELAGLMTAVGVGLDVVAWQRLEYQPGWAAVPLGVVELADLVGLGRLLGVAAPLRPALVFFAAVWLLAQVLGHAVLPLVRLSYAEDGGELGRTGIALAAGAAALLAAAGGTAWARQPPTVHLRAGLHGPLVLDGAQTLVGDAGAVVRGGLRITADGVTVRGVTVVGAENGIEVVGAQDVRLEHVTIVGAREDGIHVRDGSVSVHGCTVRAGGPLSQGVDVSFAMARPPSTVDGCTVVGGREGVVSHYAMVMLRDNEVLGTSLRGIAVTEMSMGHVERNRVADALGVGIFCGDSSECEISRNTVVGTRADVRSGDATRMGYGIEAHNRAVAEVHDNAAGRSGAFLNAEIRAVGDG
jgi:nitrous oxidase accessory protein NosD